MMPITQIACLGLSHHYAPVELRERLSCGLLLSEHMQPAALGDQFSALSEVVLLATCNRIELYAVLRPDLDDARPLLQQYLAAHHDDSALNLNDTLYYLRGEDAVRHLLRVTSGLDSQILGEPQILGQVTSAFMQGVDANTTGPVLTTLFRGAFRTGKKARTYTAISSNPASLGSVAISLAEKAAGPLQERNVLVIGLGEMGQIAINALRKRGVPRVNLANRTRSYAEQLTAAWQGAAFGLDELPQALAEADVVISATAAPGIILNAELVQLTMLNRRQQALLIIDVALPRDVDPRVAAVPGVQLFNIDDLHQSLDEALTARQREIPRVEAVIAEEMDRLRDEFRQLEITPVIADLRQKAEAIRRRELQRALRFIGDDVDPETLKRVQHLSRSLVNKILHEPTTRLRRHASNGQAEQYSEVVRELFDLPDKTGSQV